MLLKGGELQRGQGLVSRNGRFRAFMEETGNFELYVNERQLFSTRTSARGVKLALRNDGNLVVVDKKDQIVWQSNTANLADYLICQNDGNLALYASNGDIRWSTETIQSKSLQLK